MKNKKYSKIIVLALSLALLIGAAIGIAASAETSTEPVIIKKNIEYGGTLKFMVAVEPDSVGGTDKTVTLSVYQGDPSAEDATLLGQPSVAEYDADVTDTNLGVDDAYIATASYGISALAYGQEYYLVVECDGVQTVTTYSAVEYFLNRLYGDDIINPTNDIEIAQKALYQNAIAYGSSAQTVAELEDTTLDTGTNVADYIWVSAQDGTVNNADYAVVAKDTALNFAYTGVEDPSGLAYWLDPNGDKTTVATSSGIYAPKFAHFTFNELSANTTVTKNQSSSWVASTFTDGDNDVSKYTKLVYTKNYSGYETRDHNVTVKDGKLTYSTITGGTLFALENRNNVETDSNYTNFESEVTIALADGVASSTMTTDFQINTSNMLYRMIMEYKSSSGILEVWFQRTKYKDTTLGIDLTSNYNTSHVAIQVATAGSTEATFDLKLESYYIADSNTENNEDTSYDQKYDRDSVFLVTVNDTPLWILDSRGVDKTSIPTSSTVGLNGYANTDGVYVCQHAYTSTSASDASLRAGLFKFISFAPSTGHICDISFDNIIFESKAVETVPTFNMTAR